MVKDRNEGGRNCESLGGGVRVRRREVGRCRHD